MNAEEYQKLWKAATEYNDELRIRGNRFALDEDLVEEYNSVLNVGGTGIIGYVEIAKIDCSLPIYHGTDESVLQIAVGHLDWTTLPIGGKGNHSVLSGHRGLPSAKLFTNLDELVEGDTFVIRVLNELFTYEVDQIRTVLPHETDDLVRIPGKDLCTLVTCTPYGVNSHRLLVRGHRVENAKEVINARVTADAMQIDVLLVAPIVAIPILLLLLVFILLRYRRK